MNDDRDPGDEDDAGLWSHKQAGAFAKRVYAGRGFALGGSEPVWQKHYQLELSPAPPDPCPIRIVFPDTQMIAEALARGTLVESHAVSIGSAVATPRDTIGWPGPPDKDEP